MEVKLAPDQQAIIEGLVSSGRFRCVDDAIAEGVRLLATTESLRQKVQAGIQQVDRGEVLEHDTVFDRLRTLAASAGSGT
jgi:antitoxin ParD1/3/4